MHITVCSAHKALASCCTQTSLEQVWCGTCDSGLLTGCQARLVMLLYRANLEMQGPSEQIMVMWCQTWGYTMQRKWDQTIDRTLDHGFSRVVLMQSLSSATKHPLSGNDLAESKDIFCTDRPVWISTTCSFESSCCFLASLSITPTKSWLDVNCLNWKAILQMLNYWKLKLQVLTGVWVCSLQYV